MKYININQFIKLTKKLSNAELTTYIVANILTNHLHRFFIKDLFYFISFYSNRQIKNSIDKLIKDGYIIKTDNKYTIIKRFVQLTNNKNNLMQINSEIIKKYKKQTISFYKYKIFELFCNDLLIKQERIKKILNISQYEIRQFEKFFEMNSEKMSLKIEGYSKWKLGLEDLNIKNSKFWYSSLPNRYIFYPCTETIMIKIDDKYIRRIKYLLLSNNIDRKNCDVESTRKLVSKPDKCNIDEQLISIHLKIIEEPRKYAYKIEKQLTELFPYFVKRNNFTKYYKNWKLCHLFSF